MNFLYVDNALFSFAASTSTTHMLSIAQHLPDEENVVAPLAGASSSEDTVHSNSVNNPGVVCGIVLSVLIVVAIIIAVAVRSKYTLVCFFIIVNSIYLIRFRVKNHIGYK